MFVVRLLVLCVVCWAGARAIGVESRDDLESDAGTNLVPLPANLLETESFEADALGNVKEAMKVTTEEMHSLLRETMAARWYTMHRTQFENIPPKDRDAILTYVLVRKQSLGKFHKTGIRVMTWLAAELFKHKYPEFSIPFFLSEIAVKLRALETSSKGEGSSGAHSSPDAEEARQDQFNFLSSCQDKIQDAKACEIAADVADALVRLSFYWHAKTKHRTWPFHHQMEPILSDLADRLYTSTIETLTNSFDYLLGKPPRTTSPLSPRAHFPSVASSSQPVSPSRSPSRSHHPIPSEGLVPLDPVDQPQDEEEGDQAFMGQYGEDIELCQQIQYGLTYTMMHEQEKIDELEKKIQIAEAVLDLLIAVVSIAAEIATAGASALITTGIGIIAKVLDFSSTTGSKVLEFIANKKNNPRHMRIAVLTGWGAMLDNPIIPEKQAALAGSCKYRAVKIARQILRMMNKDGPQLTPDQKKVFDLVKTFDARVKEQLPKPKGTLDYIKMLTKVADVADTVLKNRKTIEGDAREALDKAESLFHIDGDHPGK